MSDDFDGRGVLYPARLPTFHREPAPERLSALVRWFWVPQWRLARGRTSRQSILPFPASNLVVEGTRTADSPESRSAVTLSGPTTRASHRDLTGIGWAVGALLRPAAVPALGIDPARIRDAEVKLCGRAGVTSGAEPAHPCGGAPALDVDLLRRSVTAAMDGCAGSHVAAVSAFADWCAEHLPDPDEGGLLANAMEDLIASDRTMVRIEQVAERLGVSVRGVQRLARRYVGLPPLAIIRRYRLQEAAQRLREDRAVAIAEVAAELGYADHAHLTADFRRVLGLTPRDYRRGEG